MELYFGHFVTPILIIIFLLLILRLFWNYRKKYASIPFYRMIPYMVFSYISGKVNKKTPFNNVCFEKVIEVSKRFSEEGFFMTYTSRPTLIIFSEEAIKFFANEKAAVYKSTDYPLLAEVMGNGILTSDGERWKTHRKLINPAFHLGALKEKLALFNEYAMDLVKDMENMIDKPSVNLIYNLKHHYFNALCESVMGLKHTAKNKAEVLKLAETVDELCELIVIRVACPWLHPRSLMKFFPTGRKFIKLCKQFDDIIDSTISDMKRVHSSNSNEDLGNFGSHFKKSVTYILLTHHLNHPDSFTLRDLRDEVATIMVTGYDTVSFSTMWCLYLLGLHPEIQEKVYQEIESIASDYVTYQESLDLIYLEAVMMESLRIYPTLPIIGRSLSEDVQFGNYKIPRGSNIGFFAYLLHRDPKVYPNPEKFEPERFLKVKSSKNWEFMPFFIGPRMCIGQQYAIIEMKVFLAHILRNFQITSLDKREDVKLCWTIVLSPVEPLRFKITQRKTSS